MHPGQQQVVNTLTSVFVNAGCRFFKVPVTDGRNNMKIDVWAINQKQAEEIALRIAAKNWPIRGQTVRVDTYYSDVMEAGGEMLRLFFDTVVRPLACGLDGRTPEELRSHIAQRLLEMSKEVDLEGHEMWLAHHKEGS